MSLFPFQIEPSLKHAGLQGSKWLTFRVLAETNDIAELMATCPTLLLCNVSERVEKGRALITTEGFLRCYQNYIETLQNKKNPVRGELRPFFSAAWTLDPGALGAMPAGQERWIIKPLLPVVQLSSHFFHFSQESQQFHSMVYSQDAIPWGLQFSYPQLYTQPGLEEAHASLKQPDLPNHALFLTLKEWVKAKTRPVRWVFQGKKITATFRMTRSVGTWMGDHPLLRQVGLRLDS